MNVKLKLTYKGPKTTSINFESEWIDEEHFDVLLQDIMKTGRFNDITILDEMEREWSMKEYGKLKKKQEVEPTNAHIYFDGGYHLDSGIAGIGIVIYYNKGKDNYRYRLNAQLEQLENNNEAEYAALYYAIQNLEEIGIKSQLIKVTGDSQGVIKQLEGEWPCYEDVLNRWLDRIEEQIKNLGLKVNYEIVSRKQNKEADKLASQAILGEIIQSHMKIY